MNLSSSSPFDPYALSTQSSVGSTSEAHFSVMSLLSSHIQHYVHSLH